MIFIIPYFPTNHGNIRCCFSLYTLEVTINNLIFVVPSEISLNLVKRIFPNIF